MKTVDKVKLNFCVLPISLEFPCDVTKLVCPAGELRSKNHFRFYSVFGKVGLSIGLHLIFRQIIIFMKNKFTEISILLTDHLCSNQSLKTSLKFPLSHVAWSSSDLCFVFCKTWRLCPSLRTKICLQRRTTIYQPNLFRQGKFL